MRLRKIDELSTLIRGIHYLDSVNPNECFYYANPLDDDSWAKQPYDFRNPYPYLCVNIGSGVSILAVNEPNKFKRVSGTRYVYCKLRGQFLSCFTLVYFAYCGVILSC